MTKEHTYNLNIKWTGNNGSGTSSYSAYGRDHIIWNETKPEILASSDPTFRGDKTKYNPEELLVASLSSCHMLWFLHLCARNGVIVTDYIDSPVGIMVESENGRAKFKEVVLNPTVTIKNSETIDKLESLHKKANELCYIANSVNFPVYHKATCLAMKD